MNERRIQRMQELIKQRVAEVIDHELSDPRRGLITITRVKVDKDMHYCDVFWSLLGDATAVKKNDRMLQFAAPYVQREIAKILHTRTVPRVRFHHDPGLAKAQELDQLMAELRNEREKRESAQLSETDFEPDLPDLPIDDPDAESPADSMDEERDPRVDRRPGLGD